MKYLIVVRHGKYGLDGRLTEDGKDQIGILAEQLVPFVQGNTVVILASPLPRTMETLGIVWRTIKDWVRTDLDQSQQLISCPELLRDSNSTDPMPALELILGYENRSVEVVIVVTHEVFTEYLPVEFAKRSLHRGLDRIILSCGQARVVGGDPAGDHWLE